MFARRKKNRSGSVSVQIVSKAHGRYRVVKTVGSSKDPDEIASLWQQAQEFLRRPDISQTKLLPIKSKTEIIEDNFAAGLSRAYVRLLGPELIFGTLFDRMGFNQVPDELFRHLVIARLVYPVSKLKTIDYLRRYQQRDLSVSALYKSLDRLHARYQAQVEALAYANTRRRLSNVTVAFYDMTTLYFEAEHEDDLRKVGYSKDGKFQHPQIMIGLLVAEQGLPIGYDIFVGNTAETTTLLPILNSLTKKYQLSKPIVVADSALLSRSNLARLKESGYRFIVGGRIKNESEAIKQKILKLSRDLKHGQGFDIKKPDGRLVVTYSDKRARKDAHNRERGLSRLRKRIKTGNLTKSSLNSRGYNKFLKLEGKAKVNLDEDMVATDKAWDGLKGYVTNTDFDYQQVVEHYSHLWQIEKAFRISKTDLRIRPIYHYRQRRIEAHVCIAFTAYAIYKELELILKQNNLSITAARAAELSQTIYELNYEIPSSRKWGKQLLNLDDEQKTLLAILKV